MADLKLTAAAALDGYDRSFGATRLREVTTLTLVSLAIPLGGDDAVTAAIRSAWKMDPPSPRRATLSADENLRLIMIASDQMMAIFPGRKPGADRAVKQVLGDTVYTTDQTDSWVVLSLHGPMALPALERICPLDLDQEAFPVGAYGRTVMEHLGTLILRSDEESYLLMSASSSAKSFLHALETSLLNVT